MNNNDKCIDVCNELLRGELAAVETYQQAIEKFDEPSERTTLQQILQDHVRSTHVLREHLLSMGATPAKTSGSWGTFAQAVEGAAKLLGESPALQALEAGEQHGIAEYQNALGDDDVMPEIKTQIRSELLPRLSKHVHDLEMLAS